MRRILWVLAGLTIGGGLLLAQGEVGAGSGYVLLKESGERAFKEKSYGQARELYERAQKEATLPEDKRWVSFRLADCRWRGELSGGSPDFSVVEEAREALLNMMGEESGIQETDPLWGDVRESLGDSYWIFPKDRNWYLAWLYYEPVLDWWAGSRDLEKARVEYLRLVWKLLEAPKGENYGYYINYDSLAPVLENALKLSRSVNEKARASYYLVQTLEHKGSDPRGAKRIRECYETSLSAGNREDWYDDALFKYGQYLETQGRMVPQETGGWTSKPDYEKALDVYRRFSKEFKKGESPWWEDVQQSINTLAGESLRIYVSQLFYPGDKVSFNLDCRNEDKVTFKLFAVDVEKNVKMSGGTSSRDWISLVDPAGLKEIKSWTKVVKAENYTPVSERVDVEGPLDSGAYLLVAEGKKQKSQELVLVTDKVLVVQSFPGQAAVFMCDAKSGAPVAGGRLILWQRYWHSDNGVREWRWERQIKTAGTDGLVVFPIARGGQFLAFGTKGTSCVAPAYFDGSPSPRLGSEWRIYVETDRAAYRPEDTVHWKVVARKKTGGVYEAPVKETVKYQVMDPQGATVKEGDVALNSFGSGWGEFSLAKTMGLGLYRIVFKDTKGNDRGQADMFRMEEYKLPEFRVTVTPSEEGGRPKVHRLGDEVECTVDVSYYFGGAVANANVEVLVHQKPFDRVWRKPRDYPWFFSESDQNRRGDYRPDTIVHQQTLKTDGNGRATVRFETPLGAGQDFEYRVEARVTDSSRREVVGEGRVRVTQKSYAVNLEADHNLFRPQDKVRVTLTALDANDRPVLVEGKVRVTRDRWGEVWKTEDGKMVRWEAGTPRTKVSGVLIEQGYKREEVLVRTAKTDAEGQLGIDFTPEVEGYYRVSWEGDDEGTLVTGETTVWVATTGTDVLGYRAGGLEILLDKESVRPGQVLPVMLVTPEPDRYVLWTTATEGLDEARIIPMKGNVKLLEIPLMEKHIPNFHVAGAMMRDGEMLSVEKEVVVPPVEKFLQVVVTPDHPEREPRQSGEWTVKTQDAEGQPVVAEVSLGLTDEAVNYIQSDLSGDPRPFFYGHKRASLGQLAGTTGWRSFPRPAVEENVQWGGDPRKNGLLTGAERSFQDEGRSDKPAWVRLSRPSKMAITEESPLPMSLAVGSLDPLAKVSQQVSAGEVAVQVRNDFRATAYWRPDVLTGADGTAKVTMVYPDSLTAWTARARAVSTGSRFGEGRGTVQTRLPLLVRLQAPRFFVVGDRVEISGVVNNNTDKAMDVRVIFDSGPELVGEKGVVNFVVPAHGEKRASRWYEAVKAGDATVRVKALGADGSADAMEKTYPVNEHGIEKFTAQSGKTRGDETNVCVSLPSERKKESTRMTVRVSPSLAAGLLDAVPYLVNYPYGCTEQTLSRFLPAVIVKKTLSDLGFTPADIAGRIFGGIEGDFAGKTHPKEYAPDGKEGGTDQLGAVVKAGLGRLYDFQHADGGWGWWKEGGTDLYMTAYAVWGLALAREAGVSVNDGVLERGGKFLEESLVKEENVPDTQAWMLHALGVLHGGVKKPTAFEAKALENLWKNRDQLNAYTRALTALTAHRFGEKEKAKILVENLVNGIREDDRPDESAEEKTGNPAPAERMKTAHWGETGVFGRWSNGGIEATAFGLQALLTMDPKNARVEPVMNWLVKNRRGAQWSNTRDTAIALLALTDYLKTSGELAGESSYVLLVNGKEVGRGESQRKNVLSGPRGWTIDRALLKDGENDVRIKKTGSGSLFFSVESDYFSLEEPIPPAGHELFVRRGYKRLEGQPTLLKGYAYSLSPVDDKGVVKSGERVEVTLTIEAKNNLEYLLLEDLKPAGLEAVEVQSGRALYARELHPKTKKATGNTVWVYQELRDRKVALFIDKLPQGLWEITYELRGEVPGDYHALPVIAHAMYVPEIRANGAEIRLKVED